MCEIDRQCFPPGIAYSADDIAMSLLQPGAFALIGEEANDIAGFILALRQRGVNSHIITIDVLHPHRRSGLGTLLLSAAHDRLRGLGAKRVVLEAAVENTPAHAFYLKHGYRITRRLKHYYQDQGDAWEMVKEFTAT